MFVHTKNTKQQMNNMPCTSDNAKKKFVEV